MTRPRVIAFDVFGTVFDLSAVPRGEIKAYVDHIRKPEWSPLTLPDSWLRLWPYGDSKNGIARLRNRFTVVTCSNAPLGFTAKLSKKNGIIWDAIIPLELNKVYKTNPLAYMTVCQVLDVQPCEVLMVTANRTFGDLEASQALGMQAQLIRDGEENPKTIIELAEALE